MNQYIIKLKPKRLHGLSQLSKQQSNKQKRSKVIVKVSNKKGKVKYCTSTKLIQSYVTTKRTKFNNTANVFLCERKTSTCCTLKYQDCNNKQMFTDENKSSLLFS